MKADKILTILHKSFKNRSKNATFNFPMKNWKHIGTQNGVNGKPTEIFFKRYGRSQKPALVKCFTKRSGNKMLEKTAETFGRKLLTCIYLILGRNRLACNSKPDFYLTVSLLFRFVSSEMSQKRLF